MTKQKLTKVLIKLFLIFPLLLNAQKYTKSNEPFTASNGKVYHIGDTIVITSPCDFGNMFRYYYFDKKFTPQRAYYTMEKVNKGQEVDNRYAKHIIKQFRVYEDGRTIAVTNKTFGYGVDLSKGIEMGEVATDELMQLYHKPDILNNESAFLITMEDEITSNNVKEYLYRFEKDIYKQNYQDEFSFNELLSTKKKELVTKAENYKLNKAFFSYTKQNFGSYDFDTNSFPIIWEGNSTRIISDSGETSVAKYINNEQIDFSVVRLYFENIEEFSSFPLPQERAKFLIDHRKQPSGKVSRDLYVGVQFIVKEIAGSEWIKNKYFSDGTEKFLICEITRIDLFEDKDFAVNYLSTVKK
ncbi:DUF4852 domain-containing protein [Saccharicrinis aurantiacus]|uniref:DUF4852 domain-containing protein n=1 Tax=Saccharicrinis aurantiacus TaxID=1849719 RepID=UPI00094F9DCB|nr:DUF4852 domain-containing protein [Saccharicrinis aurantiacus]